MSLDKAIEYGKEHRKPYKGWAVIDKSYRNHGSEEWAISNRTIATQRREQSAKAKITDYENYGD